jgi:hypothetical protein
MPKVKYHCEICDHPYDTEEEARKCESQGAQPFLFKVGEVLKPVERHGFQSTYQPTQPSKVTIKARSRGAQNHENLYDVPQIGKVVCEAYLKSEFEKINA